MGTSVFILNCARRAIQNSQPAIISTLAAMKNSCTSPTNKDTTACPVDDSGPDFLHEGLLTPLSDPIEHGCEPLVSFHRDILLYCFMPLVRDSPGQLLGVGHKRAATLVPFYVKLSQLGARLA